MDSNKWPKNTQFLKNPTELSSVNLFGRKEPVATENVVSFLTTRVSLNLKSHTFSWQNVWWWEIMLKEKVVSFQSNSTNSIPETLKG